ncbi:hypothetical protein M5689_006262 [Euphorbia peplus]|nr:hypothetical protein M5689_006262 [Euphorbia peplus]
MTLAFAVAVNGGLTAAVSYAGLFSHRRVLETTGFAFLFSILAIALIYSGYSLRYPFVGSVTTVFLNTSFTFWLYVLYMYIIIGNVSIKKSWDDIVVILCLSIYWLLSSTTRILPWMLVSFFKKRFVEYIKNEEEKKLAEAEQKEEEKAKRMLEKKEQIIKVKDSTRNFEIGECSHS